MVRVDSEVGRLRRVLIHEPGVEVDRMVPAMLEELLFDDILYGDRAREEHAIFRRVLQLLGIEVVRAGDLLRETLEQDVARDFVMDVLLEDLGDAARRRVDELSPGDLAAALIGGFRSSGLERGFTISDLFDLTPIPNYCFQRDPQVVLGGGVIFCSMSQAARNREAFLSRVIFRFHPELSGVPVLFDPLQATRQRPLFVGPDRPSLEGGDVLVLSPEVVAVGCSERTNRRAIKKLARALGEREDGPQRLLMVDIPRRRAYMHLDTLLTPVDRDACLVFPPVILAGGGDAAVVYEADLRGREPVWSEKADLLSALAGHGLELEPIACGGEDPIVQQREQWTDGANALAVAPGVVTIYDRNVGTAQELDRRGFRVVGAEDLLLGKEELDLGRKQRACILCPSHEISRARGGPHCLTHPLNRDD